MKADIQEPGDQVTVMWEADEEQVSLFFARPVNHIILTKEEVFQLAEGMGLFDEKLQTEEKN